MVATIKRQLQLLLPGVRIFLDVDDLETIDDLEVYIEASQAMLVLLGSVSYFTSFNCQREMLMAERLGLPLVRVHDGATTKNGTPLPTLRAESQRLTGRSTDYLFNDGDVISWHRIQVFQQRALAAIAEALLLASPEYAGVQAVPLCIAGGLAWAQPTFAQRVTLWVSRHNLEAAAAARELVERFEELYLAETPEASTHRLLFLSATCFQEETGERLAAEVEAALRGGSKPLLLWSPERTGEFDEIINATPRTLVQAGLYGRLAIEWHARALRDVSINLTAKALGAQTTLTACERFQRAMERCKKGLGRMRARVSEGHGKDTMMLTMRADRHQGGSHSSGSSRATTRSGASGRVSTAHVEMHS